MSIDATRLDHRPDDMPTGAFHWLGEGDKRTIVFGCPCGCGDTTAVPVMKGPNVKGRHWGWDGKEDAPTLTPSLQRMDGCKWHGWLRGGKWVTA